MGEYGGGDDDEFDRLSDYLAHGDGDDARVAEWEIGLPCGDELTPLSQALVPPELASAFRITPANAWTLLDVHRASRDTVSALRRTSSSSSSSSALRSFASFADYSPTADPSHTAPLPEPSNSAAATPAPAMDDADSSAAPAEISGGEDPAARALKRPRLVWSPQLHKRFVDVVAHLGIKNAVPKTIMQLMNVEGLTRENVASHLQKYRLYVNRMQGLSNERPSPSDHLFATTPVPQSLQEPHVPVPMPYAMPAMFPMPVFGMGQANGHGGDPMGMGMLPINGHQGAAAYSGFSAGCSHPRFMPGEK